MQIYDTTDRHLESGLECLPAARSGGPRRRRSTAWCTSIGRLQSQSALATPTRTSTVPCGTNKLYRGRPDASGSRRICPGWCSMVRSTWSAAGPRQAHNSHITRLLNTWRTIAPLPTSGGMCQAGGGFVQDNELWIVGCLGLPINQQVWIYNPGSNAWRAGPQYNANHEGGSATSLFNARGYRGRRRRSAEMPRPLWNRPVHARLELPHQRLRQLRRQHSRRRQQRRQRSHRRRRQVRRSRLHLHQRLHHWRRSRCTRMVTKCTACKRWTYSGVG